MRVTGLHTYPIKGVRALSHDALMIEPRGPVGDRRWMIVDNENHFFTQRDIAEMATISVEQDGNDLTISALNQEPFTVPVPDGETRVNAMVWGDVVYAALADNASNDKISTVMGRAAKLVYMDDKAKRSADPESTPKGSEVSFADGYPLLLTSEKSLQNLNDKIIEQGGEAVPMARFRSNLVVDGDEPWAEDEWAVVQAGDMVFDVVWPCTRCVVTTRDQMTGLDQGDNQPIRALTQMRMSLDPREKGVLFGWNLVSRGSGTVNLDDEFKVLERRERWAVRR